jgi:hypothetical protein
MAIDSELVELMVDFVTIYPYTTTDAYGKRSKGSGTKFKCRLIFDTQLNKDNDGRDVLSSGRIITADDVSKVTVDSKLLLPDGSTPPIVSVSTISDETAVYHHAVIKFGR